MNEIEEQENRLKKIEQSQRINAYRSDLEQRIQEQEDKTISILISNYRAGTLTTDMARGMVGELAALRGLLSDLDADVRTGFLAAEEEFEDADPK